MTKIRFVLIFILVMFFSTLSEANSVYSPQELASLTRQFEKQYERQTMDSKIPQSPLQRLQQTLKLEPTAKSEWLLSRQIKALHNVKPTAKIKHLLEQLSHYQSNTKTWLLDGHYQIEMVAWPIAATAKGLLTIWEIEKAQISATQNLTSGNWQLVLTSNTHAEQLGYINAVRSTPSELLAPLINHLLSIQQSNEYQQQLFWAIASKSKQIKLYNHAFSIANKNTAITILKTGFGVKLLTSSEQISLLKTAVNNPHLASAALLQLAPFIDDNNSVATLMIETLSDPKLGGSAARALVSSNSFSVKQLLELLTKGNASIEQLRAKQILIRQQQDKGGL